MRQSLTLAWRTVVQVRHNPWELGDFSIQPIMFVLLFTYVFGGAIAGSTGEYLTYALPGIIVMNMLFVTMYVGTGLNTDLTKGVFDRLRSLAPKPPRSSSRWRGPGSSPRSSLHCRCGHSNDGREEVTRPTGESMKQPGSHPQTAQPDWAVVTGASSGLGREFALALAERGHPVLAVARRGQRLSVLADEVHARGGQLEPLVADLSTVAGVETLIEKAATLEVGLLVNNAGVARYGPFASLPPERDLIRLNVEAIVALTRGLLPAMLSRGSGGVINVASQMAFQPTPYFASYAASKAFVLSFTEALAEELRGKGVRVTAVAPGFVSTEFADVAGSQEPQRRFPQLQPRHVVEAALRAHNHGRTVKVIGALYAFLTIAGRFAPRVALRRMMGRAMRPITTPRADSLETPST
jgi:hypothetical protein